MTAYGNMDRGFAGMPQGLEKDVFSRLAAAQVEFGAPVFLQEGNDDSAFPFIADQALITYDADFVASNSIAATVNGVAITPVVYATSHAATFAAVVAAIDGLTDVSVVSSDSTARTILVETTGVTTVATSVVTLGTSQAGVTVGFATSRELGGVAQSTQKTPAYYAQYDAINIMREGTILVAVPVAVDSQQLAYLTSAGVWTNVSSGNVATNYKFRSSTSGAGLADLEVIKKGAL